MKLTLKAWRQAREKTQSDMAKACNVHINTYRRWESNPGIMPIDKAIAVSDCLQVRLDDIFLPENTTHNSI